MEVVVEVAALVLLMELVLEVGEEDGVLVEVVVEVQTGMELVLELEEEEVMVVEVEVEV